MKKQTLILKTMTLLGCLLLSSVTFAQGFVSGDPATYQLNSAGSGMGGLRFLDSSISVTDRDILFPTGVSALEHVGIGVNEDNIKLPTFSPLGTSNYGLSLNSTIGTIYDPTNNSYLDQFPSLYTFKYDFFNDKSQSNLFEASECKKSCNVKLTNCGWGPLTETALKSRLKECGMTLADLTLEPEIQTEQGLVSCHSLSVEDPAELASLAQLIDYDCNIQRKDGENDGNFCGCILDKAANPKEKLFSPLSKEERSKIAAMTQLDQFQKKTAEIQSGLFQVSKILAAAVHDSDTQDLFKGEGNEAKACLPGSFEAIGTKFNTPNPDDNKLICGEQGNHRLNEVFKRTVIDCAGNSKCSKEWPNMRRAANRIQKGNQEREISIFRFLQHQSVRQYENDYQGGSRADGSGAASDEAVDQVRTDIIQRNEFLCQNTPNENTPAEEVRRYNANCIDDKESFAMPAANLNYLESIISYIDEYRSNDDYKNNIDGYVASLEKDPAHSAVIANIKLEMLNEYKVLKVGVFENHSDHDTTFAKILALVNDSIPEGVNLNSSDSGSLMKAAADLDNGFKDVKIKVAKDAMKACKSYLVSLAVTCREMDQKPEDMIKNGPSPYELTNFSPAGAAVRYLENKKALGSMYPTSEEGLRRKFELYRCGNLMRDSSLSSKAFDSEGIDVDVFNSVFASITDPKLETGTASDVDVAKDESKVNIYMEDDAGFSRTLSRSGDSDLEELGKAISRAKRATTFSRDLKSVSDNRLGGAQGGESLAQNDQDSTLSNIADMAKKTLSANGGDSSSSNMGSFKSESDYASSLSGFNKEKLKDEEEKLAKEKKADDDRLDVIASRLADLMANKKKNNDDRAKKESSSDKKTLAQDSKYQEMLIEKLKLEKEIASLGVEKRKLKAKKVLDEKLTAMENEKEFRATKAQSVAASNQKAAASKTKSAAKGGSGTSGASRKIASAGGSSGSAAGSGVGSSTPSATSTDYAPYVITLTQDQVTAIKQKFQVVENANKWVAGGKPPVIREGNIFYELAVEDGKIIVPFKKKPLNGFNVAGLRVPASDKEPLPMKVDKKDVERRRTNTVIELNAILDLK